MKFYYIAYWHNNDASTNQRKVYTACSDSPVNAIKQFRVEVGDYEIINIEQ